MRRVAVGVGIGLGSLIVLSLALVLIGPGLWVVGLVVSGVVAPLWLLAGIVNYSPRRARRAIVLSVVAGIAFWQPLVGWHGKWVTQAPIGHRVSAEGVHVLWLDGWLPVVFRLDDWAIQLEDAGGHLNMNAAAAGLLYSPGFRLDDECGCDVSHLYLYKANGRLFVLGAQSAADELEPTWGFGFAWAYWIVVVPLMAWLIRRGRRWRRLAAAGQEPRAAAGEPT